MAGGVIARFSDRSDSSLRAKSTLQSAGDEEGASSVCVITIAYYLSLVLAIEQLE